MVVGFWVSFAVTLALFGATLWAGLRHRRRLHFTFAPLAVVALTVTIVLTEQLVRAVSFPPDEMAIHLFFAKSAAGLLLPVIATGLWMARSVRARPWHRAAVVLFLLFTLTATGTGIWVFSLSTPK